MARKDDLPLHGRQCDCCEGRQGHCPETESHLPKDTRQTGLIRVEGRGDRREIYSCQNRLET